MGLCKNLFFKSVSRYQEALCDNPMDSFMTYLRVIRSVLQKGFLRNGNSRLIKLKTETKANFQKRLVSFLVSMPEL